MSHQIDQAAKCEITHYRWVAQLWSTEECWHHGPKGTGAIAGLEPRRSLSESSSVNFGSSLGILRIRSPIRLDTIGTI